MTAIAIRYFDARSADFLFIMRISKDFIDMVISNILIFTIWIIIHESIHYLIFNYFSCTDITIAWLRPNPLSFLSLVQVGAYCSHLPVQMISSMELAHSINEIIGYNFIIFITLYWNISRKNINTN